MELQSLQSVIYIGEVSDYFRELLQRSLIKHLKDQRINVYYFLICVLELVINLCELFICSVLHCLFILYFINP